MQFCITRDIIVPAREKIFSFGGIFLCLRIIRGSFVSEETNKVLVRINLYHIWKMRCIYENTVLQ